MEANKPFRVSRLPRNERDGFDEHVSVDCTSGVRMGVVETPMYFQWWRWYLYGLNDPKLAPYMRFEKEWVTFNFTCRVGVVNNRVTG